MTLHRPRVSGYIVNKDTNDVLRFQYNPIELVTDRGNKFSTIDAPGIEYPALFYSGGEKSAINLTLEFYDGATPTSGGRNNSVSVMAQIDSMASPRRRQMGMIRGVNHFVSPPICVFVWGSEVFSFVLQKYTFKRKYFNERLQTVMLSVSLEMLLIK